MIYVIRYVLISLYTVFWGTLGLLLGLVDRSGESLVWVGRQWLRWVLASCGVEVEVEGLDNVDRRNPFVLMSNHQSLFDIAAIVDVLPVSWRFVAKRELLWVPFFGWALAVAGQIIVDRGNNARAVRSMKRAAERIASGVNVLIFPEGTRSPSGELQPFKSGGFHLALQAQVPILPATVSGSRRITPKKDWRVHSGRIKVTFGKPIETKGLTVDDRQALKDRVRDAITAGYDRELQTPPA